MKNHIYIDNKLFIGNSKIIDNLILLKHINIPIKTLLIDKYKSLILSNSNKYNFVPLKKSRSVDKLYVYGRMSDSDVEIEYNYIYSYVHLLLEKYDGIYKEFYLFNNENDWNFFSNSIENNKEYTRILMIQWINIITRAIQDALRESKSTIKIYYFLEIENIEIENKENNIINTVLPHINIDLVVYTNNDNNKKSDSNNDIINYIYSHMKI
jgi:hypothetical protein